MTKDGRDAGVNAIEKELQGERATALGDAGRRLETALAELAANVSDEDRLEEAATAAWYFVILRESLHMFDHKAAFEIYKVPPQVLARVGVIKRRA